VSLLTCRHPSGTVGLLIAFLTLAFLTSAFAFSTYQFSHAPRIRAGANASTSTNWSGYAVTGLRSSVSYVNGSWIVPTVTASATNAYSSFWVGIDGYSSGTVEQIGTDSDWVSGVATYYAWYEFYPKTSHTISTITVHAGDVMYAEVQYSSGSFTVSITDTNTGQSFSTSAKVPSAQRSSAEWIAEAPSSGGVLPLANFGTVYFGNKYTGISTCYATVGGVTDDIGSFGSAVQEITMVDSSGLTNAEPSSLMKGGNSFYIDRITSSGTGTTASLSVSVSTDKATYVQPSWVYITVVVTDSSSGQPIAGATVSVTVTAPNGATASGTGTTNSSGSITFRYRIGNHSPTGTYTAKADVTASGYDPASGSTQFQVT
jgi:hypothetical protein